MAFGNALRTLRNDRGLSQEALAEILGTSKQVISRYETGQRVPRITVAKEYAEALGVSLSDLIGDDVSQLDPMISIPNLLPLSRRRIPILGPIAAGIPIHAEREYDEYVSVCDDSNKADAGLRVQGDSMSPRYLEGDIVLIRYQPEVCNGQVAAVQIDNEVTLKQVYRIKGGVQLVSINGKYAPMIHVGAEAECVHIIGLAVGYLRWE